MSVYVGIDVHRKRSQVAVVTEDGTVQLSKNTVNGTEPILRLIGDLPSGMPVASGAAFGWSWLARLLEGYSFEAHMVHPLRCKAIASARGEERQGPAPRPWPSCCAPTCSRKSGSRRRRCASSALLRHRTGLVRLRTQLQNRIHAVVADVGYDRSGSYLSGPGRGWLAGLELPAISREIVTDCLTFTGALAPGIDRIDGRPRQHAKTGPRVKVLTTLPGAGQFTALVMLAGIGDITRFPNAASWPAGRA